MTSVTCFLLVFSADWGDEGGISRGKWGGGRLDFEKVSEAALLPLVQYPWNMAAMKSTCKD